MTMLDSAEPLDSLKPMQSMFATPEAAAANTPSAPSTGAPPVSPAATLAYPSGESFDSISDLDDGMSDYTPPASRDANPQVLRLMPQPAMMTFGSGSGTGAFRDSTGSQEASPLESSTAESAAQKRDDKKRPAQETATAGLTSSTSSAPTTAKSLFTARAMSIKDLKLDSCIDASIESTGITLDDIAAYVKEPDSKDRSIDGGKKWTCIYPGCGKKFGRKENIKSHIQTHLGDRQFKCNHCNKCFVRGHDLKRHAKIHTGLKPYPCECGNSFARHDALTRHKQRGMCSGAIRPPVPRTVKRGRPRTRNIGTKPASRPDLAERIEKAQMTREKIQAQAENSSIAGINGNGDGYSSAGELSCSASTISSSSAASPPAVENLVYHNHSPDGQLSRIDEEQQYLAGDSVGLPPGVFTFTPPTSPGSAYSDIYKIDKGIDQMLPQWNMPGNGPSLEHGTDKPSLPHGLLSAHQFPPSPANVGSPEPHVSGMLNSTLLVHDTPAIAPEFDDGFSAGIKFMPDTLEAGVTTDFSSSFTTPELVGATAAELDYQPGLFLRDDIDSGSNGSMFSDDRYSPFSDLGVHHALIDDGMLSI
ncbi:Ras- protein Rab-35 [Ascosphaera pollenicola]|nr:Ras- protein Rab-35 [Ascosphaera pollenicola]